MVEQVLLECGCMSMATCTRRAGVELEEPIPACFIHDCFTPAKEQPNLSGRNMRCDYFGRAWGRRGVGPIYGGGEKAGTCTRADGCHCEIESNPEQPFFQSMPDKEFDKFYCGCHGWD